MESFLNNLLENSFVNTDYPVMGTITSNLSEDDTQEDVSFNKFSYPEIKDPFIMEADFSMPEFDWDYEEQELEYDNLKNTFSDPKEFVQTLNSAYKKALRNNNLDEGYSKILVAQDAAECNWGKSVLGNFNYGNITTTGDDWHKKDKARRKWKDFDSIDDYAEYKIKFLSRPRYNYFNTFSTDSNVSVAMQTLANRGYDPGNKQYGNRVKKVYDSVLKYLKPQQIINTDLIKIDIETLFKQEGLTSVNGKALKFGNKNLRDKNASYGAKNSNHKHRDPYTGNANARDISITNGNENDYYEFRRLLLNNPRIVEYLEAKNWGIINEITLPILKKYGGTGPHFHFGPDTAARRTWQTWKKYPNIPVTQLV